MIFVAAVVQLVVDAAEENARDAQVVSGIDEEHGDVAAAPRQAGQDEQPRRFAEQRQQ